MMSKKRFIDVILDEHKDHREREKERLHKLFLQFDDNGDGVLTLEEFEALVRSVDSAMSKDRVIELFNQTLEMFDEGPTMDEMSPHAFCEMALQNTLGGYGKELFSEYFVQQYLKKAASTKAAGARRPNPKR